MRVELHNHTGVGSMLDSTNFPEDLVKKAKSLNQPAVAITEHGYLTTAVDFYMLCKKENIKPIIGCEMYMTENHFGKSGHSYHLILLCKDNTGWTNLKTLCTKARLEGFYNKPRIDFDLLSEHHEGLICMTACLGGELPKLISSGTSKEEQLDYIARYKKLFGNDFYLEIQGADNPEQKMVNLELLKLSQKTGVKVASTCDCHFLNKEDFELHNVFIQMNQNRDNEFYKDCWFKTESEIHDVLDKYLNISTVEETFRTTLEIADKCNLEMDLGHSYLPDVILPEGVTMSEEEYIWYLIDKGMIDKGYKGNKVYEDRIKHEMDIITKKGFIGYFLILLDFIKQGKKRDFVFAPGRGSAAGSLVCDVLGITYVDPIKYGLMFERFLTLERTSLPDK